MQRKNERNEIYDMLNIFSSPDIYTVCNLVDFYKMIILKKLIVFIYKAGFDFQKHSNFLQDSNLFVIFIPLIYETIFNWHNIESLYQMKIHQLCSLF